MERSCIILNPRAGQGRASLTARQLREHSACLQRATWFQTTSPGHATKLAWEAACRGFPSVFAAGGDGTVNEVINGLMQALEDGLQPPVLGILPLGSANDFARGIGIAREFETLLEQLDCVSTRRVDIGQVTNERGETRFFGVCTGIGLLAAVASESNEVTRLHGTPRYVWGCIRAFRHYRRGPLLDVRFDEQSPVRVAVWYMSINNTPTVGGVLLSPDATMNDGALDVVYMDQISLVHLISLFPATELGIHLRHPVSHVKQVRHLTLWSEQPFPVIFDGESDGTKPVAYSLSIRVVPSALCVLAQPPSKKLAVT